MANMIYAVASLLICAQRFDPVFSLCQDAQSEASGVYMCRGWDRCLVIKDN